MQQVITFLVLIFSGQLVVGQVPPDSTFDLQNQLFSVSSGDQTTYFGEDGIPTKVNCTEIIYYNTYALSRTIIDSIYVLMGGPNKGNVADIKIAILIGEPEEVEVRILEAGAFPDTLQLKEKVRQVILDTDLPDQNAFLLFDMRKWWSECVEREKKNLGYTLPPKFKKQLRRRKRAKRKRKNLPTKVPTETTPLLH